MGFSLNKAAAAASVSKSTIGRALKDGRLSAQRTAEGWSIEPAELFRVFPQDTTGKSHSTDAGHSEGQVVELEVLRVKVAMLTDQLESERDTVADLRRRLDRAEERILALSHSPTTTSFAPPVGPVPQPAATPPKRSIWRRWF